ncbi:hypothetical protein BKM31_55330 [[Actinomadura] parvosata subsp. kistnae]|uniref:Uncharacterized protein n=1 Tax=[Actinomadura] parvosata subsp. kistnae TaxID=1909395 RepID=A0A1V0AGY3_9ACTN|nr:hypothetical protein BKM31_55330 [Nonomuraea sp. ATCC 55076]
MPGASGGLLGLLGPLDTDLRAQRRHGDQQGGRAQRHASEHADHAGPLIQHLQHLCGQVQRIGKEPHQHGRQHDDRHDPPQP